MRVAAPSGNSGLSSDCQITVVGIIVQTQGAPRFRDVCKPVVEYGHQFGSDWAKGQFLHPASWQSATDRNPDRHAAVARAWVEAGVVTLEARCRGRHLVAAGKPVIPDGVVGFPYPGNVISVREDQIEGLMARVAAIERKIQNVVRAGDERAGPLR